LTIEFSPYAPIRLRDSVWWRFAKQSANQGFIRADGAIAGNLPDYIMNDLVGPMMRRTVEATRAVGGDEGFFGQAMAKYMTLRHWVPIVGQYELNGRQIFDLDDQVVQMLSKTDVSDCTLEDWHPPYDAFFLRFGKQEHTSLEFDVDNTEHLDGAFVAVTPWDATGARRIKFGLTTVKSDGSGVMMPGYFLDFTPEDAKLPVPEALQSALRRKFNDLKDEPGESRNSAALNEIRRSEYEEGATLMRQALDLIVNALFYIESLGDESKKLQPGRDVPPELHTQWSQRDVERRRKISQKIVSEGYAMVHMLGAETARYGESASERGTAAAHWRRGHWRKQPYGEGRSQTKRVWIRPVMVNQERPHEDLPGRIYAVTENRSMH
jgi:hypothetical protein